MSGRLRLALVARAISLSSSFSRLRNCRFSTRLALSMARAATRQTADTVSISSGEKLRGLRRSSNSRTPMTRSLEMSGTASSLVSP